MYLEKCLGHSKYYISGFHCFVTTKKTRTSKNAHQKNKQNIDIINNELHSSERECTTYKNTDKS